MWPRPLTPLLCLLALATVVPTLWSQAAPSAERSTSTVERRLAAMGTSLQLSVEHLDRAQALRASEAAVVELERVEARLSTWRDESELSRLNRTPVRERMELTPELYGELVRARQLWSLTGGAFDPGIGAALAAWKLREGGRLPGDAELATSLVRDGFDALRLGVDATASGPAYSAERLADNLCIEEGGFGKGLGLDRAAAVLRASGALSARLDLGGQVLLFGRTETFALADPRDREHAALSVLLDGGSMATSGNSERGFAVEGQRYSHLFDPRTGAPVADFGSLTVIAPDGFLADALSTGLYVLGPERALELAQSLPEVELILLDTRSSQLRAILTEGLRGRISSLDPEIRLDWAPSSSSTPLHSTECPAPSDSKP